jgi:hypothetical protein
LHGSSQQLLRRIKARSPPQDAPRTLRRVREDALQPALERLVSQRRRLLDHVKSKDEGRYQKIIERLGIRR